MKEAYVTFKVAKLLKEKGFNIPSDTSYEDYLWQMYDENGKVHWGMYSSDWYFRITQQMACRWLREEHKIFIGVDVGTDMDDVFGYMPFIHVLDNLSCSYGKYVPHVDADTICNFTPQTYEDAVETALEYCLTNLI